MLKKRIIGTLHLNQQLTLCKCVIVIIIFINFILNNVFSHRIYNDTPNRYYSYGNPQLWYLKAMQHTGIRPAAMEYVGLEKIKYKFQTNQKIDFNWLYLIDVWWEIVLRTIQILTNLLRRLMSKLLYRVVQYQKVPSSKNFENYFGLEGKMKFSSFFHFSQKRNVLMNF